MPFTPAHPALVLPFLKINRQYLSATGLVLGSISPDFEYFVRMSAKGQSDHTLAALFFLNIPVAVIGAILFHQVVKTNLLNNLPRFFQARFEPLRQLDFVASLKTHPAIFLLSVALGAASHLLWDSFTHHNGYFVQQLSFYNSFFPFEGVRYPMFYALQYISSFAGMLVIVLYVLFQKPDRNSHLTSPRPAYWLLVVAISGLFIYFRFALEPKSFTLDNLGVTSITAVCCSLLIAGGLRFSRLTH